MEDKKILGVNRNIFFLGLVSLFNDFSAEMVQSVMPIFLTVVLGAPAEFVGFLEGFADAIASILKLFSGWFSDKIGKRKLPAVMGYALSVGVRPLLSLVGNFWQVFELRVVDRIGKGFRDAPRDALIAESVPKNELGKSFGFHRSLDTLGATLGPLVALIILPLINNNYRHLFLIAFFIGLGAIFSFVFVKEKRPVILLSNPVAKPKLNFALLKSNKRFALVVLSIFIFGLGTLPILLAILRAKEVGLGVSGVPLAYFIYNLTFVLVAIPLGRLADKIGERTVIASGFFLAATAYFGLAGAASVLVVVASFVVLGIYSAATDGLMRALAAKHLTDNILATGQGFLNMAVGFSSLVAGIIGGVLWTNIGSSAAFLYAGTFSIIGLILFLIMTRNKYV
ncbi:MAG: MFS transporter [Patescibacteria group bacterium]|nr:MFS transporter [Patescibacteria group bacterium]MDE2015407.1 MFS transporter [Patescibacteria group bacterium]MDE2226978.1 MFS transporter [Patescibacteria group bacterium]